jgi:hypothetical protein
VVQGLSLLENGKKGSQFNADDSSSFKNSKSGKMMLSPKTLASIPTPVYIAAPNSSILEIK